MNKISTENNDYSIGVQLVTPDTVNDLIIARSNGACYLSVQFRKDAKSGARAVTMAIPPESARSFIEAFGPEMKDEFLQIMRDKK